MKGKIEAMHFNDLCVKNSRLTGEAQ